MNVDLFNLSDESDSWGIITTPRSIKIKNLNISLSLE